MNMKWSERLRIVRAEDVPSNDPKYIPPSIPKESEDDEIITEDEESDEDEDSATDQDEETVN